VAQVARRLDLGRVPPAVLTPMPHANRNFVIAYIFLVGLPVLGLVGVLKSGRGLTAPLSVDGTWKIQATDDQAAASPCGSLFSQVYNQPLSISQSGNTLVIALNNGAKTATGALDGRSIRAHFTGANDSNSADCSDRSLTLTATLDPQREPRTLRGRLSIDNCRGCSAELRASRQPRSVAGGVH
jgi:hypothetical protein